MSTASVEWELWSTRARLVVTDPGVLTTARELVDSYLARVDDAANRFRADSEISRLTERSGWVTLSSTLTHLLERALAVARMTDGDVDPTVGGAVRRLGYDRDLRLLTEDGGPVRAVISPVPGYRSLRLDGSRLHKAAGVELDLGATAKAAAADRAASLVHAALGTGVLVSLGGDIATAGAAPGSGWQIHVQDRDQDPWTQVELPAGSAIATSSTVSRQWHRGGRPLHHIVDPRTGQPARPVWRSVTVAAGTCLRANAVTTAALVRGKPAVDWVRGLGLPARFLRADGVLVHTDGWPTGEAA
jgi:thiamine biosynthesis lipoprotein